MIRKTSKAIGSIVLAVTLASGTAIAALATVEDVGGGTWNYGTSISGDNKTVWSNYVHPTNYHSSTAIIASKNVKRYANAGHWSNASATAAKKYTGYTYYNPNA